MTQTTYMGSGLPSKTIGAKEGDYYYDTDGEAYYQFKGTVWKFDQKKTEREYYKNNFCMVEQLERQQAFSANTFGPRNKNKSIEGLMDHIRKELVEIEADPGDLEEWIDLILLATDGAWRMVGCEAADILRMLEQKQAKNESRRWPDWRTVEPGTAIEHIED